MSLLASSERASIVPRWKRYPAYRESGVDWLNEIPAHWEVKRLKNIVHLNPESLPETTRPEHVIQYVDISNVEEVSGISPPLEMRFEDAPSRARRVVRSGDTILSTVRTYLKAIAYFEDPPENFIVSTGFAVLRPVNGVGPRYLYALVRCKEFVEMVVAHSVGVGYPAINPSELSCLPVWLPSPSEQNAIVAFLDRETAKIDELVKKKEQLVELLYEKRTAIISQAVAKGLGPDVPMKDSGIEWLGKIPAHWEVKRLKHVVHGGLVNGLFKKKDQFGSGVKLINVVDLYRDDFLVDFESLDRVQADLHEVEAYGVSSGDILFVRSSLKLEGVGSSACVPPCGEPTVFECHLVRARPSRKHMTPEYLISYLNSSLTRQRLVALAETTTMTTIAQPELASFEVLVPPLEEQALIAAFLKAETATVEALIAKVREGIEKLKEYRTALISAAVTGKIDVREEVSV